MRQGLKLCHERLGTWLDLRKRRRQRRRKPSGLLDISLARQQMVRRQTATLPDPWRRQVYSGQYEEDETEVVAETR